MGRIRIAKLIISVLLSSGFSSSQALDLSQFYLPPCCYIPPQGEPYSGYASAIINTKHLPNPALRESREEPKNVSLNSNQTKVFPPDSIRLYKLIVPIDNEIEIETENTTNSPLREDSTHFQPPSVTVENILFSDLNISEHVKFKRNSNLESFSGKNVSKSQKIILLDIEEPESSYSEKKSLSESLNKLKDTEENTVENLLSVTTIEPSWRRLKSLNSNTSDTKSDLSKDPLQEASSEIQTYPPAPATRKMPAIWLQNLRRALYQSLTSEKTEGSNQVEAEKQVKQRTPLSKQIWKTLRRAKLKYIDKLSQSSSDLPEAIYLPAGQGPIVSGVVVNSANGVELRLASELYVAPEVGTEAREDCQCSLIHHGDIVMAYWSVSRIFNEHSQPALQYLVYPLPHTVPTPPEFLPFPGNEGFRPSPVDPVANLKPYEHVQHIPQHHNNHLGELTSQYVPSPPYFHKLVNGHHRLEITQNPIHTKAPILSQNPTGPHPAEISPTGPYPTGISPSGPHPTGISPTGPHPTGISPTGPHPTGISPTGPHPTGISPTGPHHIPGNHPHHYIKDYRGVLVENEYGYTPEFLDLYRTAIAEHFRQKDSYHHHRKIQEGFVGPSGSQTPHYPLPPTDLPPPNEPPVQENPIIGPTHPPPVSSLIPHIPHYPNSIQDILAPIQPPSGPSQLPPLIQPPSGPSQLPPLDIENLYPHPAVRPPVLNTPPETNYPSKRPADRYPPNDRYPDAPRKGLGNKDTNRPHTPSKIPGNKDKYPPKHPVGGGDVGVNHYPFPPNRFPPGGPEVEFGPPSQPNYQDIEGLLPVRPSSNHPERPQGPYYDRDRYDNKIYDDDPSNNRPIRKGVGTAYNINDKLYYPDVSPKPYVKYSKSKPFEIKKIPQEINEEGYILNF